MTTSYQEDNIEVSFYVNRRESDMLKFLRNQIGIRTTDDLLMYLVNKEYKFQLQIQRQEEEYHRQKQVTTAKQVTAWNNPKFDMTANTNNNGPGYDSDIIPT